MFKTIQILDDALRLLLILICLTSFKFNCQKTINTKCEITLISELYLIFDAAISLQ